MDEFIEESLQELQERSIEACALLGQDVPKGLIFGIDEESSDLMQHRALVSMARCFVLIQRLRGREICDLGGGSIGERIDREIVKLS